MIRIYGASDDLVEIVMPTGHEELDAYNRERTITIGSRGDHAVVVTAQYVTPGVWSLAVRPIDEGVPMFPCKIEPHTSYSPLLTVECPEGTAVMW